MSMRTVLLVEDNEKLNEINRRALEGEGYRVLTALSLKDAREHLVITVPDVILLDVVLPDGEGFDFCKEIRDTCDAHILFLTSRREHEEKLHGLALGGDDYITKPFKLDELVARVAAAMRRREISGNILRKNITRGNLTLDTLSNRAYINGRDLMLRQKEFALLSLLVQQNGKPMNGDYIYQKIWNQPTVGDMNALRTVISRVRKKIGLSGFDIYYERGCGYSFE